MATRTYKASEQLYISSEGRMVYPGETFTVPVDVKPGKGWLDEDGNVIAEEVSSKDAGKTTKASKTAKPAAAQADPKPNYSEMSLEALQAEAAKRSIKTDGLDEAALRKALTEADAEG